jgi:hypothetical protein
LKAKTPPFGAAVLAAFATLGGLPGCFDTRTIPDEEGVGATSSSAGGKQANAAGATATSGGSDGLAGEGGNPPTAAAAGSASGGTAGQGPAGGGSASEVTWLLLEGSAAPSSDAGNAALGINGAFYAYGDDCATLVWDESTRCASGKLCTAGADFENWGIAVGFDFYATGASGDPPDSKLVWNPDEEGVRGVTWRIRGTAPGRQVWVLNMEPAFQGICSVMTCEIAGPPDGAASAAPAGQLLFDDMIKDNWGGRGTQYRFDPAAVYALQFKLPAINVGSASFDFCIDALGVVR